MYTLQVISKADGMETVKNKLTVQSIERAVGEGSTLNYILCAQDFGEDVSAYEPCGIPFC